MRFADFSERHQAGLRVDVFRICDLPCDADYFGHLSSNEESALLGSCRSMRCVRSANTSPYSVWSFNAGALMTSELIVNENKSIGIPKRSELAKEGWRVVGQSIARSDDKVWKLIYTLERGD